MRTVIDLEKVKVEYRNNNRFEIIKIGLRAYIDAVFYKDEKGEVQNYWASGIVATTYVLGETVYSELCFDDFDEAYTHYDELIEQSVEAGLKTKQEELNHV